MSSNSSTVGDKSNDDIGYGSTTSNDDIHSDDISSSAENKSAESKREEAIAQAEDKAVFRIRLLVIAILMSLTVGIAILVYHFTRKDEIESFEQSFLEDSEKVFDSVGMTLDASLGAVDAYAVSVLSYAAASNSTWPLVAVPNFASRVSKIRSLSKAYLIGQFQIVEEKDRLAWEKFTVENAGWVDEALQIQESDPTFEGTIAEDYNISPVIYDSSGVKPNGTGPYYPSWQQYPTVPLHFPPYNWDGSESTSVVESFSHMEKYRNVVIASIPNILNPNDPRGEATVESSNTWVRGFFSGTDFDHTEPYVDIYYPIFDDPVGLFPSESAKNGNSKLVSVLTISFYWRKLLENVLPPGSDGLVVVFENACGQSFTYQINGPEAVYMGPGDRHDMQYDDLEQISGLHELKNYHKSGSVGYTGFPLSETWCPYTVRTYPSEDAEDRFLTSKPAIYTATAISIFLLTSAVFFFYDLLVERRQEKVMKSAIQSNAIVSSLFPSNVRHRLHELDHESSSGPQKNRLKTWLSDGKDGSDIMNVKNTAGNAIVAGRPIADLFPEATVLFADIAGFTAWSSIREPSQVFILLENLYGAFDTIAAKRGVFKVETIGDSYVAVAGLPEPRKDHAIVMAKFAGDCLIRMDEVTRQLGVTLGPDTEDLAMRFGLHSGPVTAGVLRGQKSRFQLFGDTVNTAARMESTGLRHKIQASQVTADHLIQANKGHWLVPREDAVEVKGKGMMQTYWIRPKSRGSMSVAAESSSALVPVERFKGSGTADSKLERLVEWNVDALGKMIRLIIHRRQKMNRGKQKILSVTNHHGRFAARNLAKDGSTSVLDEVKEIIELPDYDGYTDSDMEGIDSITLEPSVASQLREYVVAIAMSYELNPFHNFEHASHVCMSVAKLLSRIVAADDIYDHLQQTATSHGSDTVVNKGSIIGSTKYDHTYGITSDPLTQFACVFSALIHDAEHPGVPNTQLVKEGDVLALKYNNRSVAEQNSVDSAWSIFMHDRFSDLRAAICPTESEMKRFRQLVVNCVMATDIMDKELKALRNGRWEKAFSEQGVEELSSVSRNRKATIVIEHLLQASDVAHTMQHWHIYRKWNERLFEEMHRAYQEGRAEKNPAEFWYKGELGFFDFYIIPLAKKLSECGVFGVSSDEYLNYAMKNREEWERRGEEVVAGMMKRLQSSEKSLKLDAVTES